MPKLITSASESISRPKSLVVLVMRAMRPSNPSRNTAAPMAFAAMAKCCGRAEAAGGRRHGAPERPQDGKKAQENVARGKQRGQRVGGPAGAAVGRLRIDQPFSKPHGSAPHRGVAPGCWSRRPHACPAELQSPTRGPEARPRASRT